MISCEKGCWFVVKQIYEHAAAYQNTAWLLTEGKMSCRQWPEERILWNSSVQAVSDMVFTHSVLDENP